MSEELPALSDTTGNLVNSPQPVRDARQLIATFERWHVHQLNYAASQAALTDSASIKRPAESSTERHLTIMSNIIMVTALMEVISVLAPHLLIWAFGIYGIYVIVRQLPVGRLLLMVGWTLILAGASLGFHQTSLANSFGLMAIYTIVIALLRSILPNRSTPATI